MQKVGILLYEQRHERTMSGYRPFGEASCDCHYDGCSPKDVLLHSIRVVSGRKP
jgi:hypothetical protein